MKCANCHEKMKWWEWLLFIGRHRDHSPESLCMKDERRWLDKLHLFDEIIAGEL